MRKILLFAFFALVIQHTFASTKDDFTFKHHTFEVSVTPAVDYYFVAKPKDFASFGESFPEEKQNIRNLNRPFVAGNFGLSYIYRPIKFVGISTGFNFTQYVSKLGKLTGPMDSGFGEGITVTFATFNGYFQTGCVSVPLLLRLLYPVKKVTLEFATGPEFLFPIYTVSKYTEVYTSNSIAPVDYNKTELYTAAQVRQDCRFGWDAQLNANVSVKNNIYCSIGPEFKLLSIQPFHPGNLYGTGPHELPYYAGVKVSFRLATNYDRYSKTASTSK